jgi:hypothetical protein
MNKDTKDLIVIIGSILVILLVWLMVKLIGIFFIVKVIKLASC